MSGRTRKLNILPVILVAACLLIAGSASGVWAYLSSQPDEIENTFVPATVTCAVEETFENNVKSDVTIRNTGTVNAYIRAAVIASFVTEDGKVLATAPVEGTDYTVTWGNNGWKQGSDGFWYYSKPVSPNAATPDLIESATSVTAPQGARLNLQIIASAVQSAPAKAVTEAWGVSVTNGEIIPN